MAGVRIAFQCLLDNQRQTIESLAHVRMARHKPQSGAGSSPRQRFDDPGQRHCIDIRADDDPFTADEHDLHATRRARGGSAAGVASVTTLTDTMFTGSPTSLTPPAARSRLRRVNSKLEFRP